jgi:dTDP-D-glucose 4,6-dehydratase
LPVNIGTTNEFTIKALADKIIALTGSKSKISYQLLPADDPIQRQPDISLAKKTLNWKPKIQLNEGLKKTIEYFRTLVYFLIEVLSGLPDKSLCAPEARWRVVPLFRREASPA